MRREVEAWIEGYEGRSGGIYKSVRVLTSDPETEGLRPPGIMYIPGIFNNPSSTVYKYHSAHLCWTG